VNYAGTVTNYPDRFVRALRVYVKEAVS